MTLYDFTHLRRDSRENFSSSLSRSIDGEEGYPREQLIYRRKEDEEVITPRDRSAYLLLHFISL